MGARGGIRTHTPSRTKDFESSASAIPPPGPGGQRSVCAVTGSSTSSTRSRGRRLARWSIVGAVVAMVAALRERAFATNRDRHPLVVPPTSSDATPE